MKKAYLILLLLSSFKIVFSQTDSTKLVFQKNLFGFSASTGFVDLSPTVQMALDPKFPTKVAIEHSLGFNLNTTISIHPKLNLGFEYGFSKYNIKFPSIYGFVSEVNVRNRRFTPFVSLKIGESKSSKIVYFTSLGVGLRFGNYTIPLSKRSQQDVFPILYAKVGLYKELTPNVRLFLQVGTGAPFASFGLNF